MAQGRLFGSACRMAISFAARRDPLRPESDPRLRLTGPPASLPLPVTRRCEREPAQQGQPATAQPRDRRRPASAPTHTRSHPPSRPDPRCTDPRCTHRCTAAEHQHRRSPGIAGRSRSRQAKADHHPGPQVRTWSVAGANAQTAEAPRTRPATRPGPALCAGQFPDDGPEPLEANTASRRRRRQLVVIAADELEPALGAAPSQLSYCLIAPQPMQPGIDRRRGGFTESI